jgi:hypothetical protein
MYSPHLSVFADKPPAELAYRGLTVAAVLALLASLWVF